jgi:hypothetical protein
MPLPSLAYALGGVLTLLILALEIRKIRINHSDSVLPAAALGVYADGDPSAPRNRGWFPGDVVKPVEPAILAETLAHLVRHADHIGH